MAKIYAEVYVIAHRAKTKETVILVEKSTVDETKLLKIATLTPSDGLSGTIEEYNRALDGTLEEYYDIRIIEAVHESDREFHVTTHTKFYEVE